MVNEFHIKGHHLAAIGLFSSQWQPEGQDVFFYISRIRVLMFVELSPFNLHVIMAAHNRNVFSPEQLK